MGRRLATFASRTQTGVTKMGVVEIIIGFAVLAIVGMKFPETMERIARM